MLLVEEVDRAEFLIGLFEAMYEELPPPKPKKKRKRNKRKPRGMMMRKNGKTGRK